MSIYGIEYGENSKNKFKKKNVILIIIIIIAVTALSILGGIMLAKKVNSDKELAKANIEQNENKQEAQNDNEANKIVETNSQTNTEQTNTAQTQGQSNTQTNTQQSTSSSNKNETSAQQSSSSSSNKNETSAQQSTSSSNKNQTTTQQSTSSSNKNQTTTQQSSSSSNKSQTTTQQQTQSSEQVKVTIKSPLSQTQWDALSNIYSSKQKVAYLTFDDGPSTTVTPQILDTLKKENVKATFFVLGTMVKSNPSLVKRERAEGHYIANHGYSHVYSKIYANASNAIAEYDKTNKLIQQALGDSTYEAKVFRFPGGSSGGPYDSIKTKAKKILKQNRVAYLDWNCLTNDAAGANTKDAIMKNLKSTSKGKNSLVILMHDAPNKKLTASTLPDVISYLRGQGYIFRSLEDLM